jgi:hypothetical protein
MREDNHGHLVGDLVKFATSFETWSRDYRTRNPGLITAVESAYPGRPASAEVYWSNGDVTREHLSFLERL